MTTELCGVCLPGGGGEETDRQPPEISFSARLADPLRYGIVPPAGMSPPQMPSWSRCQAPQAPLTNTHINTGCTKRGKKKKEICHHCKMNSPKRFCSC